MSVMTKAHVARGISRVSPGDRPVGLEGRVSKYRSLRVVVPALALLGAFTLGPALGQSPAQATTMRGVNATASNWTPHWWDTDGCSRVPDSGFHKGAYYDFHHACVHHDGCYRNHWASKGTCDDWFLIDMYATCRSLRSGSGCYDRARAFYTGVIYLGGPAYNGWSYYIPMQYFA